VTTDTNIIKNPTLKRLFDSGRTFRAQPEVFPTADELIESLSKTFNNFIVKMAKNLEVDSTILLPWRIHILTDLTNDIIKLHAKYKFNPDAIILTPDVLEALKELQKDFIITYADKSSNDYAFVCKQHYHEAITKELATDTFTELRESAKDMITKHIKISDLYKCKVAQKPIS
jgi:hypothetical protein